MINVVGIDPGHTTGIATLHWHEPALREPPLAHVYACDAGSAAGLLDWLLAQTAPWAAGGIEEFRRGKGYSPITSRLVTQLTQAAANRGLVLSCRPAVTVKRWSSDTRLRRAGLWDCTAKMIDAKDAARHALYSAVYDAGVPDPLSKRTRSAMTT